VDDKVKGVYLIKDILNTAIIQLLQSYFEYRHMKAHFNISDDIKHIKCNVLTQPEFKLCSCKQVLSAAQKHWWIIPHLICVLNVSINKFFSPTGATTHREFVFCSPLGGYSLSAYEVSWSLYAFLFFCAFFVNRICLACIFVILCIFVVSYVYLLYLMCICFILCVFVVSYVYLLYLMRICFILCVFVVSYVYLLYLMCICCIMCVLLFLL